MKLKFILSFFCFTSVLCSEHCPNGFYYENHDCHSCIEENVAYFGNNLEGSPLSRNMSLADCQVLCHETEECLYWTYNVKFAACYLKSSDGLSDFLREDLNFISGVKKCPNHKNADAKKNKKLVVKGQALDYLSATFGQDVASMTVLHGLLPGISDAQLNDFCQPETNLHFTSRGTFALAKRGGCEFVNKAFNAQLSGYRGLIILDTESETKFSRIVASKAAYVPSTFIKIPVVFLMDTQAKILLKELVEAQPGEEVKMSFQTVSSQFVPIPLLKNSSTEHDNIIQNQPEDDLNEAFLPIFNRQFTVKVKEHVENFISSWSPLSLAVMAGGIIVILILIVACQVCLCSKCFKKRRSSRVLPDSCTHQDIPNMTSQLPNSIYVTNTYEAPASVSGAGERNETFEVACPVCLDVPLPPRKIYQCSQGHGICDICLTQIDKKCPTCREDWSHSANLPARNRMAEAMLENYFGGGTLRRNSTLVTDDAEDIYAPSAPPIMSDPNY